MDARYRVDNGPLPTATTAKLFWANGTAIANILSPTPIVPPEPIPVGGPGSSGVITFNIPGSAFGTPPSGATHLLLVLDYENLVTEGHEDNNSVALGPCNVGDFPEYSGPEDGVSLNDADATLKARIEDFRTAVLALPGTQYFKVNAVYRPYAYQAHLRQIRDKYVDLLLKVPGVTKDPIRYVVNGKERFRPHLKITPGTPAMLCKTVLDHVNQECEDHTLVGVGPYKAPGVNKPENSLHTVYPALAVDVAISGNITDTQIGTLAANNHLVRPCDEAHHFQLEGSSCNVATLEGTIVGNSPINLLVSDPSGRRIGFDPVNEQIVNEIGDGATYSGSNSEPQVVVISPGELLPGNYHVTGLGTGAGSYSISFLVISEDAGEPLADIQIGSGTASLGTSIEPVPPIDFRLATIRLSFERVEDGLLFHWPAWTTNLTLQSANMLTPPNWSPAEGANYADKSLVVTNLSNGVNFFRLIGP